MIAACPTQANPADPGLCTIAGGCVGTSFGPDKRLTPFMPWAQSLANAPMSSPVGSLTFRWPYKNLLTGGFSSNHLVRKRGAVVCATAGAIAG